MANYNSKYTGAEIDKRLGLAGDLESMTIEGFDRAFEWVDVTKQATKNEQYFANGKVGNTIQETSSPSWATLKLHVVAGGKYRILFAYSPYVDGVFLVDANNTINRIAAKKEETDAVAENEVTVDIKDGETFLYINYRIDNGMGGSIEKFVAIEGLHFQPLKPLFEYNQSNNYIDVSTIKVGMIISTGDIATGGSFDGFYCFENYIPTNEGEVLSLQWTDKLNGIRYWSETIGDAGYAGLCFAAYDEKYKIISSAWIRNVNSYTVPKSAKFVRVSLTKQLYDNAYDIAIVKDVFGVIPYEKYGVYEIVSLNPDLIPASIKVKEVLAFLPDEICCAVGRTIEIYNSQVCPLASKYHFQWDCRVGKAMKRKFSIEGTEALIGDYPLALTIYDDNLNVVFAKTVTLKIVNALSVSKSICPIGDSLTNNKRWLNEVMTLSSNKVSFVGTRPYISGITHEGRSGFSTTSYLTASAYNFGNPAETVHPFWDGTKFSWSYYKSTTGISPDAVQIYLGTNDFVGNLAPAAFASNIKQMVDSIREADANIPIFLVLTICWGNQDGIGVQTSSDGFASQKGRFKYDLDLKTVNGVKAMYETMKSYTGVYFVPLTECHDSEYNFGAVETPVNPRATQKEYLPEEAVHPQDQGYNQMADVMYSVYCRAFA